MFDNAHPVIYFSGSKHHEYFTRDNDLQDSLYSHVKVFDDCDDNVNGRGTSLLTSTSSFPSNNVGEPTAHPPSRFVNELSPFFPGHTIWDGDIFFDKEAGSNLPKADGTGNPILPPASLVCASGCHNACLEGAPLTAGCSQEVATVCSFDPFCCESAWDNICVSEVASGCQ